MDAKTLLAKWIEAFNRHDVDVVASYYHDDAVNWQVADEPVAGKAQIRAMLAAFFAAFPDSYARVENLMGDGEWAAWEWVGGGTFLHDLGRLKATGKAYEFRGCGFFRVVGGKIKLQRGYWDKNTWLRQIDVPLTASMK
jgi:steroid delta-isomerase-like uncharacterized protein